MWIVVVEIVLVLSLGMLAVWLIVGDQDEKDDH